VELCKNVWNWLKVQGVILAIYMTIGAVVYGYLENWPPLDTAYFLVVSATTVGYGDLCPETPMGRLFTCFYALIGIFTIMSAVSPFIEWVLTRRKLFEDFIAQCAERATRDDQKATAEPLSDAMIFLADTDGDGVIDENEAQALEGWVMPGNSSFVPKYVRATSGPLFVFLIGIAIGLGVLDLTMIDASYFSVITMTTIGYGDINFLHGEDGEGSWKQYVGMFFLPLAVTALADAVGQISSISIRKTIQQTDFAAKVDQLLLEEAKGNPEETLTEAEFLISVLKANDLVDDDTLLSIRLQFARITRHKKYEKGQSPLTHPPMLDAKALFAELVSQGRIVHSGECAETEDPIRKLSRAASGLSQAASRTIENAASKVPIVGAKISPSTPAAGVTALERGSPKPDADVVNLEAPDEGFGEWYEHFWLPRVLENTRDVLAAKALAKFEKSKREKAGNPVFGMLRKAKGGK
jgi:hypothetical protein